MTSPHLLLVGCGRMGGAMLSGWLSSHKVMPERVAVVEAHPGNVAAEYGVTVYNSPEELSAEFRPDIVVIAVKPQVMAEVLPLYRKYVSKDTVFVSVAAGKSIASMEGHLGSEAAVIRTMPNLPALIQQGVFVSVANGHVPSELLKLADGLFSAVGMSIWIQKEELMDAVTAVSGSGPAYFFHFIESMLEGAEKLGLTKDMAWKLVIGTLSGSMHFVQEHAQGGGEVAVLRKQVTSPGGTTEAGLNILMSEENSLQSMIEKTLTAARDRGKELG